MDFQKAARVLGEELSEKGYDWRLDNDHSHPRLYISCGGREEFAVMSSSASYDSGNLLNMKRQDIKRDVLPKLPVPDPKLRLNGGAESEPKMPNLEQVDSRVFGVKVFLRGTGSLVVQIPKEVIPKDTPAANVFLTENNRLYLIFSKTSGSVAASTRAATKVAYTFKRKEVPFKYAAKTPDKYKAPELCARFKNGSLISDDPLPSEIITGKPKRVSYSLTEGTGILDMLNEWIVGAEKQGLEPKVSVSKNRVEIKVAVKVEKTL